MRMLRLFPEVTPLSPADWDDVMLNLQAGKSGQRAVFNLKSSHLQSLPYCLPALACSDEDEARRHAERMIEQFETDPGPEAHHRTTVRLFRRGCPFRLDLERFVGGVPRHALGRELREEVAIRRFFYSGESIIEEKHRYVSQEASKHWIAPVRVSLSNRLPMLERWLAKGHLSLEELVECFALVRRVKKGCEAFGIDRCPELVSAAPN